MRINDSVFIVTGGGSGLGAAAARMIAAGGGRVVIADINATAGAAIAADLGDVARFVVTDVADEASAIKAIETAYSQFGGLHGLINCAGICPGEKVVGRDGPHVLETFTRAITVNLIGTFNMVRLAAAAISAGQPNDQGERGIIINTASIAAFDGQIGQAAYAASKGGVIGMTLPIARELARHGIRVMTIAPGIFATPMVQAMPQEVQDSLARLVPFPARLGDPAEFADLCRAIIGNVMLNGEVIRLDGAVRMAAK
ncbi:SDR family NAD(P)-dependent oxidoreductase [Magnetospirillum fulvum]|uniref:Short-chain dehydrogenase n=1 Tax=Magnetospirillum fulvum MGU-K5 TaxID=1316936 RepID=S9S7E3_MAGFU|nr:SDR family NAD(P)-dependent oxidoreductase [Magnetospirillum fulvum]EPY01817.1 short-chain dehydrogenase [Magnetospirillum fulvum MGU-K5]